MLIEAHEISRVYGVESASVAALRPTTLSIAAGEFVAILGPSGSGKSTLMNIIGLLDRPSTGTFHLNGRNCAGLTDDQAAELRNKLIGFVFQSYHLLPRQSVLQNVELPLIYAGVRRAERRERAVKALAAVRMSHRVDHLPSQLSGGEQQRAAIARSIVTSPSLILADEPTGALDSATGWEIMRLLIALNRTGRTIVLVTHDSKIAQLASRIVTLRDGDVVSDEMVVSLQPDATAQNQRQRDEAA
ncbi:MAG: ABC transporter ATP-binding protein [Proteobacteria bacterium]|nr:ABC transporter ATP-binding protein [Pseudomonadota bacterium]